MKKEQFIKNLRYSLRKLKKDEREKYLAYYEEIISDMIENGVSEEEAVAHQGETKRIAEEILRENAVKRESKIGWIGTVLIILTLLCRMVSGYLIYQEYRIKSGIEKTAGRGGKRNNQPHWRCRWTDPCISGRENHLFSAP